MQFNLVNDQQQVAQSVWCGVAWRGVLLRCMALALGFISILGEGEEVPAAFVACVRVLFPRGAFPWRLRAVPSGQRLLCIIMCAPAHVLVVLLGSAFGALALVCFLVFPLPALPIQGSRGLSSIVFSIEHSVQCDGA